MANYIPNDLKDQKFYLWRTIKYAAISVLNIITGICKQSETALKITDDLLTTAQTHTEKLREETILEAKSFIEKLEQLQLEHQEEEQVEDQQQEQEQVEEK